MASPNVALNENITRNAETYDKYENWGLVPFFLSHDLELMRLRKLAFLNHNTDELLDARQATSLFRIWRRRWAWCLPVRYRMELLIFWKAKKFRTGKTVSESIETVICISAKEILACAKRSICSAVIPRPCRPLSLSVTFWSRHIPTPETTTFYNLVRAVTYRNGFSGWKIPTGALV